MSDETSIPGVPTDAPVDVRKLRHSIQKHAYYAAMATAGAPGLAKADQMIRLDKCIEELEIALAKAKLARQTVAERDFDAHQAVKAEKAVQAVPHDALPESPEKEAEALTFQDLINQLSGETAKPEADKPEDQPPF